MHVSVLLTVSVLCSEQRMLGGIWGNGDSVFTFSVLGNVLTANVSPTGVIMHLSAFIHSTLKNNPCNCVLSHARALLLSTKFKTENE